MRHPHFYRYFHSSVCLKEGLEGKETCGGGSRSRTGHWVGVGALAALWTEPPAIGPVIRGDLMAELTAALGLSL